MGRHLWKCPAKMKNRQDCLTSTIVRLYLENHLWKAPEMMNRQDCLTSTIVRSDLDNRQWKCIIDDEQPGQSLPIKLDQGVKRKRENYGRTVSNERKKIKLDPDFYPPAPHGDASSSDPSAGGLSQKQGGKRKRKTDRRSRSEHQFETLIDSLSSQFSHMYISTPLLACVKTHKAF